jgi:hypothetical protein
MWLSNYEQFWIKTLSILAKNFGEIYRGQVNAFAWLWWESNPATLDTL